MNFLTTISGSLLEGFYPKGWDLDEWADSEGNALPNNDPASFQFAN